MRPVLAALLIIAAGPCLAESPAPDRLVGHGGPIRGLAVSGNEALSASFDYTIIHWTLEGSEGRIAHRLAGHEAAVNGVAFVPGKAQAVSVSDDGTLGVWNLADGTLTERFRGSGDKMLGVAVSPGGRFAATAGWDRVARVFDLDALEAGPVLADHDGPVNAVAFSEDGNILYTAAADGTIRAKSPVQAGGESRLVHRHGWGVNILHTLPDGRLFFGGLDGTVAILGPSGEILHELPTGRGPVLSAAIHAGKRLLAFGAGDGEMKVVALDDMRIIAESNTTNGPVWALAFAADGRSLWRGGLDDSVFNWSIDPQKSFEPVQGGFPRRFQATAPRDPGERQFARKCSVCHTLTPDGGNRAGPTLFQVIGRKVATVPGYPYSEALRNLDIVWTEEMISALFEHGPDVVTPGSKMPLQRMTNSKDRNDLVAYLRRAAGSAGVSRREEK